MERNDLGSAGITATEVSLGKYLRAKRDESGLSQADVAEELGLSESTVSRLESGKVRWHLDIAVKYLEVVGTPFSQVAEQVSNIILGSAKGTLWQR